MVKRAVILQATHNTGLLQAYSQIDERCRMLGYAVKKIAKTMHINDASQQTLSSYAYVLMVIFFLQKREPAVLPCLQEVCSVL